MPLYMTQFSYTSEAWATLAKNPEAVKDRSAVLDETLGFMGGRLVSWYLSLGDYDCLVIYEAPDNTIAGNVAVWLAAMEDLRVSKTTPVYAAEESVEVIRGAGLTPTT
jgi:uncharacterized protein with GYD domain